jgi:gamma-glutamylcyclotransferase (GGCT)/AIG2-like uncharacterized protein YtfP
MLYLAYGSNLNKKQMKIRCPKSVPLKSVVLENAKLCFEQHGVANIRKGDSKVYCAIYEVSDDCIKALDRYEGYPYLYKKVKVKIEGLVTFAYVLNSKMLPSAPSVAYYNIIKKGYLDWEMNPRSLDKWLKETKELIREG